MLVTPVKGRKGNAIVRFEDWIINKDGPQSVVGLFSKLSELPEIGKPVEVMISGAFSEEGKVRWLWLNVINEDFVPVKLDGFVNGENGKTSYGLLMDPVQKSILPNTRMWFTPGATAAYAAPVNEPTIEGIGYVAIHDCLSMRKRSVRISGLDDYKMLDVWQKMNSALPIEG